MHSQALKDFNRGIGLKTHHMLAGYTERGILYYQKGEYHKALADLEHCKKKGLLYDRLEEYLPLTRKALKPK